MGNEPGAAAIPRLLDPPPPAPPPPWVLAFKLLLEAVVLLMADLRPLENKKEALGVSIALGVAIPEAMPARG